MPIDSIILQPAVNSYNAAYRPILFIVAASSTDGTNTPPVVYCDIYFSGVYYKTLAHTKRDSETVDTLSSIFIFDIQDAVQEQLKSYLGANGGSLIESADTVALSSFVKFRASGIDTDGFIQPEGTLPVRATGGTPAVSGTGTISNIYFVVNAVLQLEDSQNLVLHLDSYKRGDTWNTNYHPLTHRPSSYDVCRNGSDFYPLIYIGTGIATLRLNYIRDETLSFSDVAVSIPSGGSVLYIPNGLKNLQSLFPLISFSKISSYWLQGVSVADEILFTTPVNIPVECCEDDITIHFLNYCGTIDAKSFKEVAIVHSTKSDSYQKPLAYVLNKKAHNNNRYNVTSNDEYNLVCLINDESHLKWIEEIFDSPKAWIEWKGTQGQPDSYIPIIILDQKVVTKKQDERFEYEVNLVITLSHDKITIRN